MKKTRWYIKPAVNKSDDIVDTILQKRGITGEHITNFLNPSFAEFIDPYLFSDMEDAVELILEMIDREGRLIIYGDYDVDGISSSSLLYLFFRDYLEVEVDYYIPDRVKEGYGLNYDAVKRIIDQGYDLMITVDCGITAFEEMNLAQNSGLKTIITDHHQPADKLPLADCIINPKVKKDSYPFSKLAGVGVAFKLCQGIVKYLEGKVMVDLLAKKLDIVALGTIADIVSLTGENRIMVKFGLDLITDDNRLSLKIIRKKLGLADKKINTGHIGFIIAPPFNASGRMATAEMGVELLISDDREEIESIAERIIKLNKKRQQEEQTTLIEAEEIIEKEIDLSNSYALILASKNWHQGVIGIAASRLVEKYYRPTIMIAVGENGIGKGSARSIKYLNLYRALKNSSKRLIDFGGHAQAAGLSICEDEIEKFSVKFNSYVKKELKEEDFIPEQRVDMLLDPEDVDYNLYKKVEKMNPFGIDNSRPVFAVTGVEVKKVYTVGKENDHLKLVLDNGLKGIAFNKGNLSNEISNKEIDIAFSLSLNNWKNYNNIEMNIKDIKLRKSKKAYPIIFRDDKLTVYDKRGCSNKIDFLKNEIELINVEKSFAVFCDSEIECDLDDSFQNNINLFEKIDEIKDKNIDKLFFFSLPDSEKNIFEIISSLSRIPDIYFLYNRKDYFKKCNDLKKKIPTQKNLRRFYKLIYSNKNDSLNYDHIFELVKNKLGLNKEFVLNSLQIFQELDLIEKNVDQISLKMMPKQKLDLSNSIRYNKNTSFIEKFNYFSKLAYDKDLFLLINEINNFIEEE